MQAVGRGSKWHQASAAQGMVPACRSRQLCSKSVLNRPSEGLRMRSVRSAAAHAAVPSTKQQQQAVVIGSGMAGLAAAEILSRHFEHVVVLEKDEPQPEWEQSAVDMAKVCNKASCTCGVSTTQSCKHLLLASMLCTFVTKASYIIWHEISCTLCSVSAQVALRCHCMHNCVLLSRSPQSCTSATTPLETANSSSHLDLAVFKYPIITVCHCLQSKVARRGVTQVRTRNSQRFSPSLCCKSAVLCGSLQWGACQNADILCN
jgi:hypothetical protein